jgi:hypothetical protein
MKRFVSRKLREEKMLLSSSKRWFEGPRDLIVTYRSTQSNHAILTNNKDGNLVILPSQRNVEKSSLPHLPGSMSKDDDRLDIRIFRLYPVDEYVCELRTQISNQHHRRRRHKKFKISLHESRRMRSCPSKTRRDSRVLPWPIIPTSSPRVYWRTPSIRIPDKGEFSGNGFVVTLLGMDGDEGL